MTILNYTKIILFTTSFLLLVSPGFAHSTTYLVRVKKEIAESTTLKVVRSDDLFNYYEVSGDEFRMVAEYRMDQFRQRFQRPKLKRMQQRIEDQFGVQEK